MSIFLCIYLIIGLIIAVWATSEVTWDEDKHLDKYDIFVLKLLIRSGIALSWPAITILAIKYKEYIDK